jgi:hypothetical protein
MFSPRAGRSEKATSFSRRVCAPELCHATARKPFPISLRKREGGGAPIGAPSIGCGSVTGANACSAVAAARVLTPSSPAGEGGWQGGALAFRRSTAALAGGFRPLAQLQAMLPGTRIQRALPAFTCPSPGTAPPAPALVPP